MARKTQKDWLEETLALLPEIGASKLTIEVLTTRLGVTKGSFYHHFKDFHDFKLQLLAYIETEGTLNIISQAQSGKTPMEQLRLLAEAIGHSRDLEVEIRGWAFQDEEVRAFHEQIDQRRITFLVGVYETLGYDTEKATVIARLLYATYIGTQYMLPPLPSMDVYQLYWEIQRLYFPPQSNQST